MVRLFAATLLSLILAPLAGLGGVLLLARGTRRLTVWRTEPGGSPSGFVSMPIGGYGWQFSSAFARGLAAFGAMRIVFFALAVRPHVYAAIGVVILFALWDVYQFRFMKRPTLAAPTRAVAVARFKIGAGAVASVLASLLFLAT